MAFYSIHYETYIEFLTEIMEELYSEGPVVIKLCSASDYISHNNPRDYGSLVARPTLKVLGVTTSSSYSIAVDGKVTYLDIPDFNGLEEGRGEYFEVWNASETICYFRYITDTPRDIAGNNDIIRMSLNMPYGSSSFNTVYSRIQALPVEVEDSPQHFPIQFKIKFPDYLLRTDHHKIDDLRFGTKYPSGTVSNSTQIYGSGEGGAVNGSRKGWRDTFKLARPTGSTSRYDDYLTFDFQFTDTLNAILTVNCPKSDIEVDKLWIDISSDFYSGYDNYPNQATVGTIDPSIFSPTDLIVERKRNTDTSFTPISVTKVSGMYIDPNNAYSSIDAEWTWGMFE